MRTTSSVPRNRAKKRLFQKVKGFVGGRRRLLRTATESLIRAGTYATRDRRLRKRDFRSLWIQRISVGAKINGMSYSRLINGLKRQGCEINRKWLSELAISDPSAFTAIAASAKQGLTS